MTRPKTPATPAPFTGGDAWQYNNNLSDPEAVKALVRALRAMGQGGQSVR